MNKKVLVIIGIVMMVLFLGLLVLNISLPEKKEAAVIEIPELTEIDPYLRIRNGFDKLKAGLDEMERQSPKSAPLVQGNGISIDKKAFLFYKFNVHLTDSLREEPIGAPDDRELLDRMVKKLLFVQQGIERGVTVSDDEIDEFIAGQRDMFANYNPDNEEERLLKAVFENRIRITGLSDTEFWQSDEARQSYFEAIVYSKYSDTLISEGTIEDRKEIDGYIDELFKKSKRKLVYNYS